MAGRSGPPSTLAQACALACALATPWVSAAAALKVNGSSTVTPVVTEAAEQLQGQGLSIQVDPAGGSSGGISALGDGRIDVAMSSRPLKASDHERFPGTDFRSVAIGYDAVALVVSRDVWEGGVRQLSREQLQGIYEGRIRRWSELGGPDRRIVFFNKEPGRGTWSMFAGWLYGDADKAPLVSFPEVGSNQETRSKVASTRGAISQLSAAWADGETVFALGLVEGDGEAIAPTSENVTTDRYPIRRPLLLITNGAPDGAASTLVDFLLGTQGQSLVEKHGYLKVAAPPTAAAH